MFTGNFAVFKFMQSTFQLGFDFPRASKCILQLVHLLLGRTGLNCTSSKDTVTDGVDMGMRAPSIDELTMIGPLLLD
jgi:hypothetical protein